MMHRIAATAAALVLLAGTAAAQARQAANLVTHSEVTIDRPASKIWPLILDPNAWKQGARAWHYAGPAGQVGEVFAAGDPAAKSKPEFLFENVELVPNQRRTIKIYATGGALIGYASWWLKESGGRTVVGYDVYSESLMDPVQARASTPEKIRESARSAAATNKARFDQELVALKKLVETANPR